MNVGIDKVFLLVLMLAAPLAGQTTEVEDLLSEFEQPSRRMVELARATPADAFSFRPVEGVRTISEVYMHVAANNFYAARDLGVDRTEDLAGDLEAEVTTKDEVVDVLERSVAAFGAAIAAADPTATIHLFGKDRSVRSVLLHFIGHNQEHYGQAIAYARSAGVTPPWSR